MYIVSFWTSLMDKKLSKFKTKKNWLEPHIPKYAEFFYSKEILYFSFQIAIIYVFSIDFPFLVILKVGGMG